MLIKGWMKFLKIYVILPCLLVAQVSMAEPKPGLRHAKVFQGIGLSAGASLEAPCYSLEYTYHLARAWHLRFALYATEQQAAIAINQLGLQTLLAYTLWRHQSNYYMNLLLTNHRVLSLLLAPGYIL
jgi:hypothetical protein